MFQEMRLIGVSAVLLADLPDQAFHLCRELGQIVLELLLLLGHGLLHNLLEPHSRLNLKLLEGPLQELSLSIPDVLIAVPDQQMHFVIGQRMLEHNPLFGLSHIVGQAVELALETDDPVLGHDPENRFIESQVHELRRGGFHRALVPGKGFVRRKSDSFAIFLVDHQG